MNKSQKNISGHADSWLEEYHMISTNNEGFQVGYSIIDIRTGAENPAADSL
jgi:hypothetical protein